MNILISGASGLVGKRLIRALSNAGHHTETLSRSHFESGQATVNAKVQQADVVIHLAGAPIIARWTKAYKQEIINSRVLTTRMIARAFKASPTFPGQLISTSAVGIYADGAPCDESNGSYGIGFLTGVCRQWEDEALAVEDKARVAIFRLGVVLANEGGALPKMALPFKLGTGGRIGSGKQGFSWIHIDDLVKAYLYVIENKSSGIYNLTAPGVTTNIELTKILSKVLHRPALFPVPEFALKLIYGEGAIALTEGQKARPGRLLSEGFNFSFPELELALNELLQK